MLKLSVTGEIFEAKKSKKVKVVTLDQTKGTLKGYIKMLAMAFYPGGKGITDFDKFVNLVYNDFVSSDKYNILISDVKNIMLEAQGRVNRRGE